jgi:signal transduction histidine kinase/AmiR/NasT family two-component response regulator
MRKSALTLLKTLVIYGSAVLVELRPVMPTIEVLSVRAEAVSPETTGMDVFARFEREPDTLVIPVVENGLPVGLVERSAFLLKLASPLGHAQFGHRPITHAMDPEPAVVEGGVSIDAFCDVLQKDGPATLMRGFIVTRDGRYHGVGTAASLLQGVNTIQRRQNLELVEQVHVLSDAKTQTVASARARNQFLSMMADELRMPMNGVLAVADLLRRQPLSPQSLAHVATIVESSGTVLRVLEDALDLARAEAGELELSPTATPLRALMDDVQTVWAPRASRDNVTLLVSYEGDTEMAALVDGTRLTQLFNTLIGNALSFARDGVVEAGLKAVAEGNRIRLEGRIRDDGAGVEPDRIDTVFDPFILGSGQGGTGLGLAICRQIVDCMGGRIWAEKNPGRGTTFAFDLDVDRTEIEATTATGIEHLDREGDRAGSPHILIVDDNGTNRVVAQALCEMFGCTSETAEDGVEALEAVQERRFDLILMDIKMPRMDGVQATQAIRALMGPARDIPIVALTANADADDARRYLTIGMAAVVEKPIKPDCLRLAMNLALGQTAAGTAPEQQGRDRSAA